MPFLNQQKGENNHRKYFMTKSPRKNIAYPVAAISTGQMNCKICCDFFFNLFLPLYNLCHKNTGTSSFLYFLFCQSAKKFCFHDDRLLRKMSFTQHLVVTLKKKNNVILSYIHKSPSKISLFGVQWPSQHYSGQVEPVSLPNHTFSGQASKQLSSTCAYSFARNRQLFFLNQ